MAAKKILSPLSRVLYKSSLTHLWLGLLLLISSLVVAIVVIQPAQAATSENLNFQARLQTAAGAIVPDGTYNIQFNIYNVASGGSTLWTETYLNSNTQGVRVKNGYLTVNLGTLDSLADESDINWDQQLWLGMTVRGTASCAFGSCTPADAEMTPRIRLTGVPYAFRAGGLATSGATYTSTLTLASPTIGNQNFVIPDHAAAGTYNILTSSTGIQNGTSPQTANFNITGNGVLGGNLTAGQLISTVTTGTAPLTVASTTMVTNLNSQYFGGFTENQIAQNLRAGYNITGGGTLSYTGTAIDWTARMNVISNGRGADFASGGFFEVEVPANGTVITGVGGASNATVTGGAIPLDDFQALYYILPIGSGTTSLPANFRVAYYTSALQVPSNWVLIAQQNFDSDVVRFGVGITLRAGQTSTAGSHDNAVFNTSVTTPTITANTIQSAAATALNITGTTTLALRSTTTNTISLDSGTTGAVDIGTGANAKIITIGNTTGATAVNVTSGTGNVNLVTNSASASVIARSNTNSTTAFQVQNAGGSMVLGVDTVNNRTLSAMYDVGTVAGGAISRVNRTSAFTIADYGTGSYTPAGTFTPLANRVLVAYVGADDDADPAVMATDGSDLTLSGGGLTWVPIVGRALEDAAADYDTSMRAFYAVVGNSPPSNMQVTVDAGAYNIYRYHVYVDEYTNVDPISPVAGATASSRLSNASDVFSTNLTQSPTVNDVKIAMSVVDIFSVTAHDTASGWTNLYRQGDLPELNVASQTGVTTTVLNYDLTAGLSANALTVYGGFILKQNAGTSLSFGATNARSTVIGNSYDNSTVSIKSGAGNIELISNGATSGTLVRSAVNSTAAFQVQNAVGSAVMSVDTVNGRLTLASGSDTAVTGNEMFTGSFAATTGWGSISGTGQAATATHTTGTTALAPTLNATPTIGTRYKLAFTLSGVTSGTMAISLAGASAGSVNGSGSYELMVTATSTGGLSFTPSTTFNGTITGVSVRSIASVGAAVLINDSAGATSLSLRVNAAGNSSVLLGNGAGTYSGVGIRNTGVGVGALQNTYSGSYNTAVGYATLINNVSGEYNTAIGYAALSTAYGGSNNVAIGRETLANFRMGSNNVAIGYGAGSDDAAGFSSNNTLNNVTLIGARAQSTIDNSLILGGAGIVGGANSTAVRVGIGTTRPDNILSVMPTIYNTGTITQSGTTVTGSGTTFTAAMVGSRLTQANGTVMNITGFTSATVITVDVSQTVGSATNYRIHAIGLQVDANGNVGAGVLAPAYALDVRGLQASNYVARVLNSSTANTADGLLIDLGVANASRATTNYFVGFASAGTVAGKIQGGASAVAYTTTAADYAEYFRAEPDDLPVAGQLVQIDPTKDKAVVRSNGDTSQLAVGIVSTNPGFVGNGPLCLVNDEDCDSNYAKYNALVALSGQVPTKVNASRGAIAIGDPIAVSSTSGEGAKAVGDGYIVGYAMEALASGQGTGTIQVLVRPQYHAVSPASDLTTQVANLQSQMNSFGTIINTGSLMAAGLTITGKATIQGDLTVGGVTKLGQLEVSGHIITAGQVPGITLEVAAGEVFDARADIRGNDVSGVISIKAGTNPLSGGLVRVTFARPYEVAPRVTLTPVGKDSAIIQPYVDSADEATFVVGVTHMPQAGQAYTFNYHVIQ